MITVLNAEVNLPETLFKCPRCSTGTLTWDGHNSWRCQGKSIWKHTCLYGLGFEAIVEADGMESGLMGGTRYDRVKFTPYGIELLWLHMRWRKGLITEEVGIQVDWLTDAEIVALYGVKPRHDLLHEEQGDERKPNKRNESSHLLKKPPVSF